MNAVAMSDILWRMSPQTLASFIADLYHKDGFDIDDCELMNFAYQLLNKAVGIDKAQEMLESKNVNAVGISLKTDAMYCE